MNHKKLGRILIEGSLLTKEDLLKALAYQIDHPDELIGEILTKMKIMEPHHIQKGLKIQEKLKKK
ncbi:MAG TPA: hypothetical protein VKS21_01990 [Spirochaetota bacterium]|nr:hypothetical protein [Spirochaetota bacterium]